MTTTFEFPDKNGQMLTAELPDGMSVDQAQEVLMKQYPHLRRVVPAVDRSAQPLEYQGKSVFGKFGTDVAGAAAGLAGLPMTTAQNLTTGGRMLKAMAMRGLGYPEAQIPQSPADFSNVPGSAKWFAGRLGATTGAPTVTTDTGIGPDLRRAGAGALLGGAGGLGVSVARRLAGGTAPLVGQAPLLGALGTTVAAVTPTALQYGLGIEPETAALLGIATPAGVAAGMRRTLRGGVAPADIQGRVQDLRAAGVGDAPPSVYIGSPQAKALDSWITKTPFIKGTYAKAGADAQVDFGNTVGGATAAMHAPTTGEGAGQLFQGALERTFQGRRGDIGQQYTDFYNRIPPDAPVPVPSTVAGAQNHLAIDPLTPELSARRLARTPSATADARALLADATASTTPPAPQTVRIGGQTVYMGPNGVLSPTPPVMPPPGPAQLPFRTVKDTRTSLYEDAHPDQWYTLSPIDRRDAIASRRLYDSMTPDLTGAADAYDAARGIPSGSPQSARGLWDAANQNYAGMMTDIKAAAPVATARTPAQAWNTYTRMATTEPDRAASIFGLVGPNADRQALAGAHLRTLGAETKGAQNAEGTSFNTDRFLTNWRGLGDPQRADYSLLAQPAGLDLPAAARVADYIKQAKAFNPNASRSAPEMASQLVGLEALNDIATGNVGGLAKMVGVLGTARLGTRGLLTPGAQNWMSSTGVNATPGQYGLLGGQYLDRWSQNQ